MERIVTRVRKWGNSMGIVLPKRVVDVEKLDEGTEITITIEPMHKTKVKDIFGILKNKIKKPTQQIMDEIDEALWPDR